VLSFCSRLTALSMGYKMEDSGHGGLYDKDIAALVDVLPRLRALNLVHNAGQQIPPYTGVSKSFRGLAAHKS
jgi:hypothetical protein